MTAQDAGVQVKIENVHPEGVEGRQLVLVDFPPGRGIRQVALGSADLIRRSEEAVNAAMGTIRSMAQRVSDAVTGLSVRPDEVEVEFGITLDAESGALIAKAGVGAALTVRLTWSADHAL
ncbi:CU044_2847 family protein [Streptomyces sp. Li-HN-5-11]|uniref:CU044_2847 family protein n=1 Tax=Streptomyces sp. Li-HN-5-11 TaxID=3075432 RepID=UPI0028AB8280|nr:CU044_2847 family protein [Streptomyces sp. Li-HN-5-11]WNM29444.1 CU044_2847 family protein [Streptomyces sp. Li-HN-5-11]